MTPEELMRRAIALSRDNMRANRGGPFGAVVARDGMIVGEGWNQVTSTNDPTAHAEIVAIRAACQTLGDFRLTGCVLYTSCEPCPMCLAAAYWARVDAIVFGNDQADAAAIDFDDAFLYREVASPPADRALPMRRLLPAEARAVFDEWTVKPDKVPY
ncbi:MAG: nucleoside deaminase [Inquilinaceae bacterium]